eukprot:TRINITY_DN8966_c0_g1_i2.p2 TRINITY_DN8966_c0_g1~~TRINITY_DN8966_c0_g1_i2.p2  ORF type:complete len:214 (+),score=64.05 TRINITY_DN8966_c0_g1_i2:88-729(+)
MGKAKKPAKVKDDEARDIILDFMNKQNRPFSAILLQSSVASKGVGKSQCPKMLDELAESGELTMKLFGKNKIYWRVQKEEDALSLEDKKALDNEIIDLVEEEKELLAECSTIESRIHALRSVPRDDEADDRIAELEEKEKSLKARLAKVCDAASDTSEKEAEKIDKRYDTALDLWKKRKRMCSEVTDQIMEGSSMSWAELKVCFSRPLQHLHP